MPTAILQHGARGSALHAAGVFLGRHLRAAPWSCDLASLTDPAITRTNSQALGCRSVAKHFSSYDREEERARRRERRLERDTLSRHQGSLEREFARDVALYLRSFRSPVWPDRAAK